MYMVITNEFNMESLIRGYYWDWNYEALVWETGLDYTEWCDTESSFLGLTRAVYRGRGRIKKGSKIRRLRRKSRKFKNKIRLISKKLKNKHWLLNVEFRIRRQEILVIMLLSCLRVH